MEFEKLKKIIAEVLNVDEEEISINMLERPNDSPNEK